MISLQQILLLQERIESAVSKIEQLNAENAALRRKCSELTNALEAKTEQFSSFQSDQNKIEEGILQALSRLDVVENAVLSASGLNSETVPVQKSVEEAIVQNQSVSPQASSPIPQNTITEEIIQNTADVEPEISFGEAADTEISTDSSVSEEVPFENGSEQNSSGADSSRSLFDIF